MASAPITTTMMIKRVIILGLLDGAGALVAPVRLGVDRLVQVERVLEPVRRRGPRHELRDSLCPGSGSQEISRTATPP
jgi:hypothetical protein